MKVLILTDLLIARLIPDHLGRHPGHCPRKAHQRAVLRPLTRGPKVTDLDNLILTNQNAKKRIECKNSVYKSNLKFSLGALEVPVYYLVLM